MRTLALTGLGMAVLVFPPGQDKMAKASFLPWLIDRTDSY